MWLVLCTVLAGPMRAEFIMPELTAPMGYATAVSRTDSGTYALTGGGDGRQITLRSNGQDMRLTIMHALHDYDVVVLDGSNGPFVVSQSIQMQGLQGKSILGIHDATLCTQFYVSPAIRQMLDSARVNDLSTDGQGGVLPNGMKVHEQREYTIRQLLYGLYQDPEEPYRMSGIIALRGCENIIIRDLKLVGPGAIDVGGIDLISCNRTRHLWVDHCELTDGMDGNFDIIQQSDFISVTRCHFHYTDRSYDHCYSNLISASDRQVADSGKLNITFAYCHWGAGCEQRMPMARFGRIHLLNCYFSCTDAVRCINARRDSEFLVEGCHAEPGVRHFFVDGGSAAFLLRDNIAPGSQMPANKGTVSVPYPY